MTGNSMTESTTEGRMTDDTMTERDDGRSRLHGRKVWVIGINYAPDQVGIAPYTTQLAEHLQGRGARVEVTTGIPYYPDYKVDPQDRRTITRRENVNGVPVRRLRHAVPRRMTAARRALHEATFLGHVLARRAPFRPDVIVGVTPALSGGLAAARMARRLGVPSVIIVQDLVGPGAVQSGIAGGTSVANIAERLEGWTLRQASHTTVLHDRFRQYALDAGVPEDRLHVVRNWSYAVPATKSRAQTRRELGWPDDRPVVLYAGNMGLKMGLRNVVDAGRLAEQRGEKILFVLLGGGSQRADLELEAQGVETVHFAESRYGAGFADALAAADILLINELPSVSNMSLPSKLAYYFTSGRPVLAAVAPNGTTALEVERADAGVVIDSGDPALLLTAALDLAADPERCAAMGKNGQDYAATAYDKDTILARYEQIIADAADGH